jgi:BTB/POZ domain
MVLDMTTTSQDRTNPTSKKMKKGRKAKPIFEYGPEQVASFSMLTVYSTRDSEAVVTFLIGTGDTPKKFIMHKERVCYYSPVLNAAFNSTFIEGQTQTYRLEDTSPSAFRLFTQWIYGQKFDLIQLPDSVKLVCSSSETSQT